MDQPLVSSPRAASDQVLETAAAALVAAAGALHLYLWFDYFHRVHVVGTLFLLNAAAAAVIAVALAVTATPLVLVAGLAYSLGTLVAFAISVRWGLFGYHESLWGSWQKAAGGVELAAGVLLSIALARSYSNRSSVALRSRWKPAAPSAPESSSRTSQPKPVSGSDSPS
jgi:hypothetical protein